MKSKLLLLLPALVVFCCLTLTAISADSATVTGTVKNGTTGKYQTDAEVSLVNPAAGMKTEKTTRAADGRYSFENVDPGMYLVQSSYQGVTYRYSVQVAGNGRMDVDVTVYDATEDWSGIRVVVPHFTATRQGDHLTIERVYDIYNESSPPVTAAGENGYFRFPVPGDMHEFHALYASYEGIPIERQPVETADKSALRVDFPIRPGLTRIAMSYEVGYQDSAYLLNEVLLYDIDQFTVFATDPDMSISSPSHTMREGDGTHSAVSWVIENLKKGETLSIQFTGGTVKQASASGAQPVVSTVPNNTEGLSILMMTILGLALLAFVAVASREQSDIGARVKQLEEHRQLLVRRMARLDDVHESGAIPGAAYQTKRMELKNQVASVVLQLNKLSGRRKGGHSDRSGSGSEKRSNSK
jgi:hypothetical protein